MSSSSSKYESVNNQPGVPGTVNDITTDLQPGNGPAFRRLTLAAPRGGLPAGTWIVLYWAGDATTNDYTSQVQIAISATQMWFREASGLNTWNPWLQTNGSPLSGVISFNGRVGVVVSILGDYSAAMITAVAAGKLIGPTVQADINYLGEVYNAGNGFSLSTAAPFVVTSSGIADGTGPLSTLAVNSAADYSDGNWNLTTGTYTVPISGRWLFGANMLLTSDATTTGSLVTWNSIGTHLIPSFAGLNDDSWDFATLPHLTAGTACQINVGSIIGTFTTTVLAGSTVFGRLMQPDA